MSVLAIGDHTTDYYVDKGMLFPGGNSVNVAVWAARAGGRSGCVGTVGDDARGRHILDALVAEGVDVDSVRRTSGGTPLVVVRHVDGERVFSGRVPGPASFTPDQGDFERATVSSIVHSSFCAGVEPWLPRFARLARVSFDFNGHIGDDYAETLLADVWFAQFSAEHLSVPQCRELIGWAQSRGPRWVLVTRGARGALLSDGRRTITATADEAQPVDTLGAGDACIGRVLHGLQSGERPELILRAGMRAAAEACSAWGGFGHGRPAGEFARDRDVARATLAAMG